MSEQGGNGPEAGGRDFDTGRPVEILSGLAQTPSSGFVGGIRRSIYRRILVSQAVDLSWNGPLLVIMEYLKALFDFLTPKNTKES